MQPGWKTRALLWLSVAESARANRAAFPKLPTAWLPHLLSNSFALALPEILAAIDRIGHLDELAAESATARGIRATIRRLCVDNSNWRWYIAAAAIAYAVSHPKFNIYKGAMAEFQVAGFGLDAIPHGMTAFGLARLMQDGLTTLDEEMPDDSPLADLVTRLAEHPRLVSGLIIAVLTAVWESGEYNVQQVELALMEGDYDAINMQWTAENTLFDVAANMLGWMGAALMG